MNRLRCLLSSCILGFCATVQATDGYVPVDPATLQSVSGESLMRTAYAVILSLMVGYSVFLWLRLHRTDTRIKAISRKENSTPKSE